MAKSAIYPQKSLHTFKRQLTEQRSDNFLNLWILFLSDDAHLSFTTIDDLKDTNEVIHLIQFWIFNDFSGQFSNKRKMTIFFVILLRYINFDIWIEFDLISMF